MTTEEYDTEFTLQVTVPQSLGAPKNANKKCMRAGTDTESENDSEEDKNVVENRVCLLKETLQGTGFPGQRQSALNIGFFFDISLNPRYFSSVLIAKMHLAWTNPEP